MLVTVCSVFNFQFLLTNRSVGAWILLQCPSALWAWRQHGYAVDWVYCRDVAAVGLEWWRHLRRWLPLPVLLCHGAVTIIIIGRVRMRWEVNKTLHKSLTHDFNQGRWPLVCACDDTRRVWAPLTPCRLRRGLVMCHCS